MKHFGWVVVLILLVGCGGGGDSGGGGGGGGGISGEWSGDINDTFAGKGTLTMNLIASGTDFLGTFSMDFPSSSNDLSGDLTGNAFETINSASVSFHGTNDPCTILALQGTWIDDLWVSGYSRGGNPTDNCPVAYDGSFSVSR